MSNNYEDEQSEDGELARSPIQEEMDFSLSDEDRDNADSLVIKPPQVVIRPSHRDKRSHKRPVKDRYKDSGRKEKKHLYREREKPEKGKRDMTTKITERDDIAKEYYREKQFYRDKETYGDKETYREKEGYREKELYREKEPYAREKEVYGRDKEIYSRDKEPYVRDKETYARDKEPYARDKEPYVRDKETYARDKEAYGREKEPYTRDKEPYTRDKETYARDKELYNRDKEAYSNSRDKEAYPREKETYSKDKEPYGRDKDAYPRDKETYAKDKEAYGRDKDAFNREKELYREKEVYREKGSFREKEVFREKDGREKEAYKDREIREKEVYKDKEAFRDREHYKERDVYREASFRDAGRQKEAYRDKEVYKEKDVQRNREQYYNRDRKFNQSEGSKRVENDRIESRLRLLADDGAANHNNEKENRDRTSGDKELEDLRSRLLSKRISKELQSQDSSKYDERIPKADRPPALDKHQQERRNKLIEAEREMEKRKNESRTELEARREERRRRGKKRSISLDDISIKKTKTNHSSPCYGDSVVTVSDASDVDMKSDINSEPEEGEHSNTNSEDESSCTESDSDVHSKSGYEEDMKEEIRSFKEEEVKEIETRPKSQSKSPTPHSDRRTPSSHASRRSLSRSKSRSRSHSFSPPPPGENGKPVEEEKLNEDDNEAKLREEAINALPPYFPALQGCRSVEEFQCLNRIEEGTYGVVYRARDKTTEEIVALKRLKMEKEKEGFPITSLREINTLLKGQHPNIVTVREIVVGSNMDKIFIVMDYVEHDLKSLMETMRGKKQVFLPGEVKCLMTQLLSAVHHLHDNWILHRDLKTSNLLLSHKGILKVGDFGLAREYGSPLRQYTPVVVTLWYRAPELLLCSKDYSTPIDMWSVGCIFGEFITMNPLFPGKSEVDELNRIFKDLGTPSEAVWPGYSELPPVQKMTFAEHPAGGLRARVGADLLSETGLTLLQAFLTYDPAKRITAEAALDHAYFKEQPVAIDPAMFPTWPAKSEGNKRTTHSPRPPAGGAAYAQFSRSDSDDSLGFLQQRSLNVAPGFSLKF